MDLALFKTQSTAFKYGRNKKPVAVAVGIVSSSTNKNYLAPI